MGADLPIDEVETAFGIGDLLAQADGELGEEIAVIACGGLGIAVQLADFAGEQGVALGVESGDVALGMTDLARNPVEFGGGVLAGEGGGVDLEVVAEQALERLVVAAAVGLVGTRHKQGEVPLLLGIAGEVGMNALGDVAEEGFEAGRRVELLGVVRFGKGGVASFVRALASCFGSLAGSVGVEEIDLPLGDAGCEVVELDVEDADQAEVAALKGFELSAQLGELRLTLGEGGASGGELRPCGKESGGVRGLLEDEIGGHVAEGGRFPSLANAPQTRGHGR